MFRECCTIKSDKGTTLAGAVLVDCLRYKFLARSGSPLDQHACVGWSDSLELFDDGIHFRAAADHSFEPKFFVETAFQIGIGAAELESFTNPVGNRPQMGDTSSLLQVGVCPLLHCGDGGAYGAMSGNDDDLRLGEGFFGTAQDLHAIDFGHHQIGEDQIVMIFVD